MSEMVKRCKRELYNSRLRLDSSIQPAYGDYDALDDERKSWLESGVRAVIAAMREPTEAMLDASDLHVATIQLWRSRIDAALDETK